MDLNELSSENFNQHAYELIATIFEIEDLRLRLAYIRKKHIELQDLLAQNDLPYTDEQIQMLQADEMALGMLERAYLDTLANDGVQGNGISYFAEFIDEDVNEQSFTPSGKRDNVTDLSTSQPKKTAWN